MQIFVHICQIFSLILDTKSQRRRRNETKQIEKINIIPTKKTLNGKRNKIKERNEINAFPFLEGEVTGLEVVATPISCSPSLTSLLLI